SDSWMGIERLTPILGAERVPDCVARREERIDVSERAGGDELREPGAGAAATATQERDLFCRRLLQPVEPAVLRALASDNAVDANPAHAPVGMNGEAEMSERSARQELFLEEVSRMGLELGPPKDRPPSVAFDCLVSADPGPFDFAAVGIVSL